MLFEDASAMIRDRLGELASLVLSGVCGEISATLTCCLPCPLVQWLYPDWLFRSAQIANWFNVPALVCQVFLLVTFAVLPQEKVHGRYLSVGLCVALVMLEVGFSGPLGGVVLRR